MMLMKDVIKNKEKNRENAHGVALTSMVYQCSAVGKGIGASNDPIKMATQK